MIFLIWVIDSILQSSLYTFSAHIQGYYLVWCLQWPFAIMGIYFCNFVHFYYATNTIEKKE